MNSCCRKTAQALCLTRNFPFFAQETAKGVDASPAESSCAVQKSLSSWVQPHSPAQKEAACVSHPLETFSDQYHFVTF